MRFMRFFVSGEFGSRVDSPQVRRTRNGSPTFRVSVKTNRSYAGPKCFFDCFTKTPKPFQKELHEVFGLDGNRHATRCKQCRHGKNDFEIVETHTHTS
jgi:hypothetical protein